MAIFSAASSPKLQPSAIGFAIFGLRITIILIYLLLVYKLFGGKL